MPPNADSIFRRWSHVTEVKQWNVAVKTFQRLNATFLTAASTYNVL